MPQSSFELYEERQEKASSALKTKSSSSNSRDMAIEQGGREIDEDSEDKSLGALTFQVDKDLFDNPPCAPRAVEDTPSRSPSNASNLVDHSGADDVSDEDLPRTPKSKARKFVLTQAAEDSDSVTSADEAEEPRRKTNSSEKSKIAPKSGDMQSQRSDKVMNEISPRARERVRESRAHMPIPAEAGETADANLCAGESEIPEPQPEAKTQAGLRAERKSAEEAVGRLAAERVERDKSMKRVELSTKESWITPEELKDPDLECWLVRVPQHDSLKRSLAEKDVPLGRKGVEPTPVMGSYVMNVRPMPHDKRAACPSTEALPTLAFRGRNRKGKARLQFAPQFSKFISVEYRTPVQRNNAPPPPRVYPKVPDGLHPQFPLAGKSWGRISTANPSRDKDESVEPTVDEDDPGRSISELGADGAVAPTQTNDREGMENRNEKEVLPAPARKMREIPKVVEMHERDKAKGKKARDLDEADREAKRKESIKSEALLSSPHKKVLDVAKADERIAPEFSDVSKQEKKYRAEKKVESAVNGVSTNKHGEKIEKKAKKKKRKSESGALQSSDKKHSKKELLEIEKSVPKEEPVIALGSKGSKKKKRRRSENGGDSEKKKKKKKKRKKESEGRSVS